MLGTITIKVEEKVEAMMVHHIVTFEPKQIYKHGDLPAIVKKIFFPG